MKEAAKLNMMNFSFAVSYNNQCEVYMEKILIDSKKTGPERWLIDEEELGRDRDYMLQIYPSKARLIMVLIEDSCDRLEYEGSSMFAEYPDKDTIRGIADRIYDKVKYRDDDDSLRHLIEVMLCNEFFLRRCRYKMRRKFF